MSHNWACLFAGADVADPQGRGQGLCAGVPSQGEAPSISALLKQASEVRREGNITTGKDRKAQNQERN